MSIILQEGATTNDIFLAPRDASGGYPASDMIQAAPLFTGEQSVTGFTVPAGLVEGDRGIFIDPIEGNFFSHWCISNIGQPPHFVSREEWARRGDEYFLQTVLGDTADAMIIPADLAQKELPALISALGGTHNKRLTRENVAEDHEPFDFPADTNRPFEDSYQSLLAVVYNLGADILSREMKTPAGDRLLRQAIGMDNIIDRMKFVRKSGNTEFIGRAERLTADRIQTAVSRYPYKYDVSAPGYIRNTRSRNCVGASVLGGAFLREAGLHYLVVHTQRQLSEHAILLLVTADGRLEWRDMQSASMKHQLTDEMIVGNRQGDGSPLTVSDVVDFSRNSNQSTGGMRFSVVDQRTGRSTPIVAYPDKYGHQLQILTNTGNELFYGENYQEALVAYNRVIDLDPELAEAYYNKGNTLHYLGQDEEALESYNQALQIDPEAAYIHSSKGATLRHLGRDQEAIDCFMRASLIDPYYALPHYNLGYAYIFFGRYQHAFDAFQRFIDLSDENTAQELIDIVKKEIAILSQVTGNGQPTPELSKYPTII